MPGFPLQSVKFNSMIFHFILKTEATPVSECGPSDPVGLRGPPGSQNNNTVNVRYNGCVRCDVPTVIQSKVTWTMLGCK